MVFLYSTLTASYRSGFFLQSFCKSFAKERKQTLTLRKSANLKNHKNTCLIFGLLI